MPEPVYVQADISQFLDELELGGQAKTTLMLLAQLLESKQGTRTLSSSMPLAFDQLCELLPQLPGFLSDFRRVLGGTAPPPQEPTLPVAWSLSRLDQHVEKLPEEIRKQFEEFVWEFFATSPAVRTTAGHFFEKQVPVFIDGMTEGVLQFLAQNVEPVLKLLATTVGKMTEPVVVPVFTTIFTAAAAAAPALVKAPLAIGVAQFNKLTAVLTEKKAAGVGNVKANVIAGYKAAAEAGMIAHLVSVLASFKIAGFGFDMGPLAAFLADIGDYGRVIDPYIDAFAQAQIGHPSRELANATYMPELPNENTVSRLLQRRIIDVTRFATAMRLHGYPREWAGEYLIDAEHVPSLREMAQVADSGTLPKGWLQGKLRRMGYNDVDTAVLIDVLTRRGDKPIRDKFWNEIYAERKDGLIDIDEFCATFNQTHESHEGLFWAIKAVEEAKWHEQVKDLLDIFDDAFARDLMNQEAYVDAVSFLYEDNQGVMLRQAKAVIAKYKIMRWKTEADQQKEFQEDVRKRLSEYRAGFVAGIITGGNFRRFLQTANFTPDMQTLIYRLADQRRLAALSHTFSRYALPTIRDLALDGTISIDQYRLALLKAGLPSKYIPVEVALVWTKVEVRRGKLLTKTDFEKFRAAYQVGLIGDAEYQAAGESAGYAVEQLVWLIEIDRGKRDNPDPLSMPIEDLWNYIQALAAKAITPQEFATAAAATALEPDVITAGIDLGEIVSDINDGTVGTPPGRGGQVLSPDEVARLIAGLRKIDPMTLQQYQVINAITQREERRADIGTAVAAMKEKRDADLKAVEAVYASPAESLK